MPGISLPGRVRGEQLRVRAIVDDLGPTPPDIDDYLNHRRWPEVAAAADAAHVLLTGHSAAAGPQPVKPSAT